MSMVQGVLSVEAVREAYRVSFRPNDPVLTVSEVLDFIDYCLSFYGHGEDAIYPYGFHFSEVCEGMIARFNARPGLDFAGDSVDREIVRDMVLEARMNELLETA